MSSEQQHRLQRLLQKESVRYIIVGGLTTLLNIGLFRVLLLFSLPYRIANIITLIVVKLATYLGNKFYVFQSRGQDIATLILEFFRFVFWRGATLLIDYFGLIALVEYCSLNKTIAKCIVTILVVIINYFTGKFRVFKKNP